MHILLDLAAHPEVLEPLREEIQSVVEKRGWTKLAMSELVKLDSFMRESAGINVTSCQSIQHVKDSIANQRNLLAGVGRACLKNYTFLNEVNVPAGVIVESNTCMMEDEEFCTNANEYMPFRYVTKDSSSGPKQFTSTGVDYRKSFDFVLCYLTC